MAITGPKVQVPDSGSPLTTEAGEVRFEWQQFFHGVQQTVFAVSRSGPTASRPTSNMDGRFIGEPYYDTDLGIPIWLQSVNPDVWVDATGAPV